MDDETSDRSDRACEVGVDHAEVPADDLVVAGSASGPGRVGDAGSSLAESGLVMTYDEATGVPMGWRLAGGRATGTAGRG